MSTKIEFEVTKDNEIKQLKKAQYQISGIVDTRFHKSHYTTTTLSKFPPNCSITE